MQEKRKFSYIFFCWHEFLSSTCRFNVYDNEGLHVEVVTVYRNLYDGSEADFLSIIPRSNNKSLLIVPYPRPWNNFRLFRFHPNKSIKHFPLIFFRNQQYTFGTWNAFIPRPNQNRPPYSCLHVLPRQYFNIT